MILTESQRLGIQRRKIDAAEIRERCLFALINEGAQILSEDIAASPADIDAIWCNGYGFPRFRGGPMFYADSLGLAVVRAGMRRFAEAQGGQAWTPAALLDELASRGTTFGEWQRAKASHVQ